jgi:hypothetical protein
MIGLRSLTSLERTVAANYGAAEAFVNALVRGAREPARHIAVLPVDLDDPTAEQAGAIGDIASILIMRNDVVMLLAARC